MSSEASVDRVAVLAAFARALAREAQSLSRRPELTWQQLYNRLSPPGEGAGPYAPPPRPWVRLVRCYGEEEALIRVLPEGKVRVDASGRLLAALWSGDERTEVVELETGRSRWVHHGLRQAEPGGACAWFGGVDDEGRSVVYRVSDGFCLESDASGRLSADSADGSREAAIDAAGVLRVRATPDGGVVGTTECGPGEPGCLALDRDGTVIAWAMNTEGGDGAVVVWDLATSRRTVIHHDVPESGGGAPASCALDDDGTLLAVADRDGLIEVWGTAGPTLIAQLGERLDPETSGTTTAAYPPLAFSPDRRFLAHGGVYGTAVRVWDLRSLELVHELFGLPTLPDEREGLAFAGDGLTLAAGGGSVCAWDLSLARPLSEYGGRPLGGELEQAAVSPDGELAVLAVEGVAEIVPIDCGPEHEDALRPRYPAWPEAECRLWSDCLIAAAFGDGIVAGIDKAAVLHVWEVEDGDELGEVDLALDVRERSWDDAVVVAGPAGTSLLACVVDDELSVYDWEEDDVVASASSGIPLDLRWSADGRFVVLVGRDSVRALDVEEVELLEGDDALAVAEDAYDGPEGVEYARSFVSVDPSGRLGIRRFATFDDVVRIAALDGSAELAWPTESPLHQVRFVESGGRAVAVTVAGRIAVLEPVIP